MYVTVIPIPHSSKITPCPAFYTMMTDRQEYVDIPRVKWPAYAVFGSSGRWSSQSRVEVNLEPSCIVIINGFLATGIPVVDASTIRKWRIVPKSNIAQSLMPTRLKLLVVNMILATCA